MSRAVAAGLWILTGAAVLSVALVAVRQPFGPGDYVAIWGLKARALERTGDVAALFRVDPAGEFSHPEYPPLWPAVLASFSRLVAGRYDDLVVTLLWPLLALAAALLAARATAAPLWGRALAAATVALLPYWRIDRGYAEGLLAVLLLAALGEMPRLDSSRYAPLRLALFLTLAAWTKQEGAVAAAVVACLLVLSRRLPAGALVAVSTGLLAILPWRLVVGRFDPGARLPIFALSSFSLSSLATAGRALFHDAVLPQAPWLLGGALLLGLAPATLRRGRAVLLGVGLYAAALVLSFAFTRLDPAWHVFWSWDRLAFVTAALLVPVLAEAVAEPFAAGPPAPTA